MDGHIRHDCTADDIAESDGIRADYEDWWFAVRPSGTEPIVRLTVEAREDATLRKRVDEFSKMFEETQ